MEQVDNAEGSSSMAGKVIADTEGLLQKGIAHYKVIRCGCIVEEG